MTEILRRQRRKEARPAEILDAALALFHEKGFAATRIDEVAQAAGVTKGTIYLYFPSKVDLFKAAIRETILPNLDQLAENLDQQASARQQLQTMLQQWARSFQNGRGSISKLVIAEAGNFPELATFYQNTVVLRAQQLIESIILRGIAQGEFTATQPALLARTLLAPLVLANIWRHSFPDCQTSSVDLLQLANFHFDVVLNGISTRKSEHE